MAEPVNGTSPGSAVARRQLGRELTALRKAVPGLTQKDAAKRMEWSQAKLWRLENGKEDVVVTSRDIRDLGALYRVSANRVGRLQAIYEQTKVAGAWASKYGAGIPEWFALYVELEPAASHLCEYHTELVTGVLQTRDYATAVVRADVEGDASATDATIAERVQIRLSRANLLTRETPAAPEFDIVLNESVIRRPVGGPAVMAAQLRHIVELSELPNVSVRILPFGVGMHPGALAAGSFVVLDFPLDGEPTTVYSEGLTGAAYLDDPDEVSRYRWAFQGLSAVSLNVDASRDCLNTAAKEYEKS